MRSRSGSASAYSAPLNRSITAGTRYNYQPSSLYPRQARGLLLRAPQTKALPLLTHARGLACSFAADDRGRMVSSVEAGVPAKHQGRSAGLQNLLVASYRVVRLPILTRGACNDGALLPSHQWHHLSQRDDETQRQDRREGRDIPIPIPRAFTKAR